MPYKGDIIFIVKKKQHFDNKASEQSCLQDKTVEATSKPCPVDKCKFKIKNN